MSRDPGRLEGARTAIRAQHPVEVTLHAADLRDGQAVKRVAAAAGAVDILVNNAGDIPGGSVLDIDEAKWRHAWDLKVFGYVNMTREVLGGMKTRGRGVIVNVIGHGMSVEDALDRPRVHVEEPYLHCEGGNDPDEVDRLVALGWEVVRLKRRNLYFGGAQAVEVLPDGSLAAAGDPRRGGHGIVVE